MAVDTAAERRAAASTAVPGVQLSVSPDAAPDALWRWAVGNSYYSPGAPPGGGGGSTLRLGETVLPDTIEIGVTTIIPGGVRL